MTWFNFNGKLFKEGTPVIGAASRGLRYGDGIFETMKMINGQLILDNEHFARLWKGMQVLQFTIPKHFEPEKLLAEIVLLAQKNNCEKLARVRLTLFRAAGGLYDTTDHFPQYIIEAWPLQQSNLQLNSNGLDIGIYEAAKKSCDVLSNLKTNNFLPYVLAALEAKKQKWNDALLLNSRGRICDSTIANVFIIKDAVLYTPALQEGCVAGIVRKFVIDHSAAAGFDCIEKEISIEELLHADEVFLTNSIYTIRWVKSIRDKIFVNTITQKIYTAVSTTIS